HLSVAVGDRGPVGAVAADLDLDRVSLGEGIPDRKHGSELELRAVDSNGEVRPRHVELPVGERVLDAIEDLGPDGPYPVTEVRIEEGDVDEGHDREHEDHRDRAESEPLPPGRLLAPAGPVLHRGEPSPASLPASGGLHFEGPPTCSTISSR